MPGPWSKIDKEINTVLKPHGFQRKGRAWHKETDQVFFALERRALPKTFEDSVNKVNNFRFVVHMGCYYKIIPHGNFARKSGYIPEESECHIRLALRKNITQVEDSNSEVWFIQSNESNTVEVLQDLNKSLQSVALPFFERFASIENAFSTIFNNSDNHEAIFGWGGYKSPLYHLIIGYLSLLLGKKDLALECFEEVMKEVHDPLFPLLVQSGGKENRPSTFVKPDYDRLKAELDGSEIE
jgi:hypothetical protein